MENLLESLVVSLRADTAPLSRGLAQVRDDLAGLETLNGDLTAALDATAQSGRSFGDGLVSQTDQIADHMGRAFERFARQGKISFDDLRSVALSAMNDIAASVLRAGLDQIFGAGGGSSGGWGGLINAGFNALLSTAGRAAGGPVSADRAFLVGERGPEIFVPQRAGHILPHQMPMAAGGARPVNITVNLRGTGNPEQLRQSAGQVALAVRRAVLRAERDS